MSVAAIFGAGPIGGAVAHRLAELGVVREIRWIDENVAAASGKALDIAQAGPIGRFDTRLTATSDGLAAAGARVIVFADAFSGAEWRDEAGVEQMTRLTRAGTDATFVFAGPNQTPVMEAAARTLNVPANRLVGTAASALVGAVQAITAIELDLSSVQVAVVGRAPAFVIGWSSATAGGSFLIDRIPAHRLLAISGAMSRLWPPGPLAIGSATARIVASLVHGSRLMHQATTIVSDLLGAKNAAVLLPLVLGHGRVLSHHLPSLSPQERTDLSNAIAAGA
jgi:malate/lactate dehydrogenase